MTAKELYLKFGRQCSVKNGQGILQSETNAFISPLRYKNKMYLYGVNTEIGFNPEGYYLYIGPADTDLTAFSYDGFITCGGEDYRIDRAEKVYKGKDIFYIWAILRKTTQNGDDEN